MAKKFTGIDITGDTIKTVELTVSGRDVALTGMAEYKLSSDLPEDALAKLVRGKNIEARNVCTGVAAGKIFFRQNSFPFKDKKKILQALPFLLADSLPFPMEEALHDSLMPLEMDDSALVATLIVKKETVSELEERYSKAGISPYLIGAENAAIASALRPEDKEAKDWMSLYIGEDKIIISFIKDEMLVASRTIDRGTEDITSKLMSGLGVNELEAADLLYSGSFKLDQAKMAEAEESIKLFIDSIIRELHLFLKKIAHTSNQISNQASSLQPLLLLSGEGAAIKDLPAYIESEMDISIIKSIAAHDIKIGDGVDAAELNTKRVAALGYALAGVSGGGINYTKGRNRLFDFPIFKIIYGERKLVIAAFLLLIFLYTMSLAVSVYRGNSKYTQLKESVRQSFKEALPEVRRIVNEKYQLATALAELEEKVSLVSDEGSVKVIDILRAVATSVPEGTLFKVTRMTIGDNEVKIDGETENFDGVEKIKSALKKNAIFADVEVGGAKASRLQNVIEFRLNIRIAS
ncbi:MAG: pilus assembly protein PilM [bacterium]|nr:pilus assembly protein PilM [bacterium]